MASRRRPSGVSLVGAGEGSDPATATLLDATGTGGRVLTIFGGVGLVVLQRLRVTGANTPIGAAGILHAGTTLRMTECTVAGNTATRQRWRRPHCQRQQHPGDDALHGAGEPRDGGGGSGGGIVTLGTTTLTDCLIENNSADDIGGGIVVDNGRTTMPTLPATMITVLQAFAPLFSTRVWSQAQVLLMGAILAPAQRTVAAALPVTGHAQVRQLHRSQRVLSRVEVVHADARLGIVAP